MLIIKHFLQHHYLLVLVGVLLIVSGMIGSVVLEEYLDFKTRPKEAMFWCFKHGYFRMKHCLPLFPDMGGTAQNSFVCPTCYKDAVFTNPDKKK